MTVNRRFWWGAAALYTVLGGGALLLDPHPAGWLFTPVWVLLIWLMTWAGMRAARRGATGEQVRGAALAFGLVLVVGVLFTAGVMLFQPMRANPPGASFYFHLLALGWLVTYVIGFNTDTGRLRAFGKRVSTGPAGGVLVLLVSVGVLLALAEFGLRFFAIQSFGASSSILTANYLGVTWGEPNALGFRDDREPAPPADDTQAVLLVGDSVAAGFGVDARADRVGDQLDAALGETHAVYLVAKPGWETQTQFEALQDYPVPPDVVVVSYFVNDVREAYADLHGTSPAPPEGINLWVDTLFVPSFLHWNVFLDSSQETDPTAQAQADPTVLAAHAGEIREMIDWTRQQNADIVYLIWPHPVLMEAHAPLLDTVREVLDEKNVPYVDMQEIMQPYPVLERIVTAYDPHPSVAMHRLAATALANLLENSEESPEFG